MPCAGKRFDLLDIEVYNLEIFDVAKILFVHDGQHLGDVFLGRPDEHESLIHKFGGL